MSEMKIYCEFQTLVDIENLKPHPKNPNRHPKDQIEMLAKILKERGWRHPVIISNFSGCIVAGHGRVEAAKLAGFTSVPVDYQDFENEAQEYEFLVADNATALWSVLDLDGIKVDLGEIGGVDLDFLGIEDFKINGLGQGNIDEDDVPVVKEPRVRQGQVWKLGNHRLMCGDSTKDKDVLLLMKDDLADLVFTDPPYGVNYDGGHADKGVRREKLANDHDTEIYSNSVPLMCKYSKSKSALYLWFAATKSLQVLQVLQQNNLEIRSWLIWNKNMAQFGAIGAQYKQKHEPCLYAYKRGNSPFWIGPTNEVSVWDISRSSKNEFHPTQKPVELSERAINNSCPKDGIVLDLFGGSGSTLIGAEKTSRRARLMELSPNYCDVIIARYEAFTGKAAELL